MARYLYSSFLDRVSGACVYDRIPVPSKGETNELHKINFHKQGYFFSD